MLQSHGDRAFFITPRWSVSNLESMSSRSLLTFLRMSLAAVTQRKRRIVLDLRTPRWGPLQIYISFPFTVSFSPSRSPSTLIRNSCISSFEGLQARAGTLGCDLLSRTTDGKQKPYSARASVDIVGNRCRWNSRLPINSGD